MTARAEESLLPKPPGVVRRYWAKHPWLLDSFVAGAYLLLGMAMAGAAGAPRPGPVPGWTIPAGIGIGLVASAAILFRRRRPWTAFAIICLTTLAGWGALGILDVVALPAILYALAVYRSTRHAWIGFAVAFVVGSASTYVVTAMHRESTVPPFGADAPVSSSQFAIVLLIVTLIGINIGNRRRYLSALVDRAGQLARERDQQAQLATAAERSRIAREMHDIVSHSLSVMVTLADGSAATAAHSPSRAADSMREVAETGRNALADMRRMLGLLAGAPTPTDLAPQPGAGDVAQLVRTFHAAGLPVRLTEDGEPPNDAAEQLTVYRIVQESLTNTLRHAHHPSRVAVDLHYDGAAISIEVVDDGEPAAGGVASARGRGLLGMRERVALYDGSIDSGPEPQGGWHVRATLPRGQESRR